jgi:hypothetical protein
LINSVLSSLAMFMLSFYEVPKEVLHKLNFYRSDFSGREMITKRSTGWQNGKLFVGRRTKVGWVS